MCCVILCNFVTEAWSFGSLNVHVWPCFVTILMTSCTGQCSVLEMHFISISDHRCLVLILSHWVHVYMVPLMDWSLCFSLYNTHKLASIWSRLHSFNMMSLNVSSLRLSLIAGEAHCSSQSEWSWKPPGGSEERCATTDFVWVSQMLLSVAWLHLRMFPHVHWGSMLFASPRQLKFLSLFWCEVDYCGLFMPPCPQWSNMISEQCLGYIVTIQSDIVELGDCLLKCPDESFNDIIKINN